MPAKVQFNGEHNTIRFADGSSQHVARDKLLRSTVLRQALLDNTTEAELNIFVPQEVLRSWLRWIQLSPEVARHGASQLSPGFASTDSDACDGTRVEDEDLVNYLRARFLFYHFLHLSVYVLYFITFYGFECS